MDKFASFLSLFSFLLIYPTGLFCQIAEDFSAPGWQGRHSWEGDLDAFNININQELQLSAPEAGEKKLFVQTTLPDSVCWEGLVRLDFAPSASNALDVFLEVDTPSLDIASGYLVHIGESGDEDALQFFRLDAGNPVLLANGQPGKVAGEPVNLRFKVCRINKDFFKIEADYTGGNILQAIAQVRDSTFRLSHPFFGWRCSFTASRKDKFFFDDIRVGRMVPDRMPPFAIALIPQNDSILFLDFNEKLDPRSLQPDYFHLDGGWGKPVRLWQDSDSSGVWLVWSRPFSNFQKYTLSIDSLADPFGNRMTRQFFSFQYLKVEHPEFKDLIINEIMADPTPSVGLPEVEYLEIYNRSSKLLSLADVFWEDGSNIVSFPDSLLFPDSFVVVCNKEDMLELSPFTRVLGLESFPALSNAGENIILRNGFGDLIDAVQFTPDWYRDDGKKEGGWSLELKDPDHSCYGQAMWSSSNNLSGGTPGAKNSGFQQTQDAENPDLLDVFPLSKTTLRLQFSEGLDPGSAENPDHFILHPALAIASVSLTDPFYNQVILYLKDTIRNGTVYQIRVKNTLIDCSGNGVGVLDRLDFMLPDTLFRGSILINEVLFNPQSGGYDYLELYNPTSRAFDLSTLRLGSILEEKTELLSVENPKLWMPDTYIVFTENRNDILARYRVAEPRNLVEQDLPTFGDDYGNVSIFKKGIFTNILLDELNYMAEWHHFLIVRPEGVALERIRTHSPTQDPSNWHSAAASVGYGTPTARNSQWFGQDSILETSIIIEPPAFSPDNDGVDDFLQISFSPDMVGYVANLEIFDLSGRKIKTLLNNKLTGTQDVYKWEGDTAWGTLASPGVYILYFEIFGSTPKSRKVLKKTCVLAPQFR